jgi:hypothetical protein
VFLSKGVQKHQGAFMQKKGISAAHFFSLFFWRGGGSIYFIDFLVRSAFRQGECKTHKKGIKKNASEKAPACSPFF